jgi:hypothetical protein
MTGPGVPRQLESGFLAEDVEGRLVLVRLDAGLEEAPGDWHAMLAGRQWDQLGRGTTLNSTAGFRIPPSIPA